ncbi:MAG: maltose alpha-D-glucosyltransferase [Desulfobacterales bacterium]
MARIAKSTAELEEDPLWFKDAVIYQLHVKSFFDSDDDGIGDFQGLTRKLDYLQDLGVSALWLMPFCPSPLRDDGYDISDYREIHPAYGTLRDFKKFLSEAHRRGLRVITELVVNHTSDQHAWFQRARHAKPGSPWREWYVWSDTPHRYADARIIFQDFETSNWTWDPVAGAYFWHRFYSHQPDLNFDNPAVRKAVLTTLDFWFGMGVDGLRLDAIPYLFEREGTNCENLPETHHFLRQMRAHVDAKFKSRMLLGEANQWPEDAVVYFGGGDECHMAFHFPLMPRLFMALHMEDRFPVTDILDQTPPIPGNCQWAIFLRNHDELTLEMVTDEERDYMYRVYAHDARMRINLGIRRRLFPLLGNHRRRTELANALLFSLPGSPVIYYGDEIGMGDNVYLGDRDGVRTPMQWSADRNAGFSRADPQKLYLPVIISPEYHSDVINVEVQRANPHSVLWWMKRLIGLRKRFKVFSRGTIEFLAPDNHRILAFMRCHENERLLVVANLSRFVQHVDLDLSPYQGMVPVELFGRSRFPPIHAAAYFLSLGPHSFYWFYLTPPQTVAEGTAPKVEEAPLPVLETDGGWEGFFNSKAAARLEHILPGFLTRIRWFGGKARPLKHASIMDVIPLAKGSRHWAIVLVRVDYLTGDDEAYAVPMAVAPVDQSERLLQEHPQAGIAKLKLKNNPSTLLLYDALADAAFGEALLEAVAHKRTLHGRRMQIRGITTRAFRTRFAKEKLLPPPVLLGTEQSNTSIRFGDRLILKLIRKLTPGVNPDLDIGRFLTERRFAHCAPTTGALELREDSDQSMTLAILQEFVPNHGDAWNYTLDRLQRYFEAMMDKPGRAGRNPLPAAFPVDLLDSAPSPETVECIGDYLDTARLLGRRTAQMHACLASEQSLPDFKPEAFSKLYQRGLYQSMRTLAGKALPLLRGQFNRMPEGLRPLAVFVIEHEKDLMGCFKDLLDHKISALRIRCHGDYHLGQVLCTGSDFTIIDFEGEPARPITERRIKRSALRDVAGMLRSFHYASQTAVLRVEAGRIPLEAAAELNHWVEFWQRWVGAEFLKSYLEQAAGGKFIPGNRDELRILLGALLMEKAVYELSYELNNRPDWVGIPLRGIQQLLERDRP